MAAAAYRPGDDVPVNNATHHKDSLNNELLIEPSAVNWKFAGWGTFHWEREAAKDLASEVLL